MRWIGVKEWLPKEGIRVLVYARGGLWIGYIENVTRTVRTEMSDIPVNIPIWKSVVSEEQLIPSHWTLLPENPRFEE
jgi:hypothetical protein